MPAKRYDLRRNNNLGEDHPIEVGGTFLFSITVDDEGTARDITGYIARWSYKADRDDATTILAFVSGVDSELTIPTGTDGKVFLEIPDETTDDLVTRSKDLEAEHGVARKPGFYTYELEDAAGKNEILLFGDVDVEPRATV